MTGSRLAVVSDDPRFATTVQSHLKKTLDRGSSAFGFNAVREHLGRDSDWLLVLVASTPAETEQAYRLVQEIYLQKLPPVLIVLETETLPVEQRLTMLDTYVASRFRWPEDADALTQRVLERTERIEGAPVQKLESVTDVVSRRLLGQTPSLMPMVERIAIASAHDVTVLLTGETGTGKTYLARLMHDCSPRKSAPFLSVPCGAQPANLVESAFFGHIKGAFTGADRSKVGKFEVAGHGSILLDEIDTLGLEQQAGLLRVIETGEFEPVGSNETKRCHARIIVASNWDLEEAVQQGRFRQDLYYRLNVMSFHLPPLRERIQDIAPLVRAMVARFNTKFRKDLFDINELAMDSLESFPWPGNIRQLENFVQQAVLVSTGAELLREHLPQQLREYRKFRSEHDGLGIPMDRDSLSHNRDLIEKNVIQRALSNNGYSRSRAASALGISRVTLYKKMKKYGLMPTQQGNE
jgi:DNA-binding NtrC family response regulator